MIGTAPGAASGVAAVVETYAAHGLFQRWNAVYLPTHRSGARVRKAFVALGAWMDFVARIVNGRVALLHVHLASNASFWRKALFILPAQLLRIPYIVHLHGGGFVEFYRGSLAPGRAFIRQVLRNAERVIALSPEWRDALREIEPGARIVVVPNPVEVPARKASLEGAPPTVLYLGLIAHRKGVQDLLHAWPDVVKAVPEARLVLAGPGDIPGMMMLAETLQVAGSVSAEGYVSGEAKEALIRKAWVLALPSHFEALPLAILEALAAGVPVVASRVGGIPTAVESGRNGLLVQARDVPAIARALVRVLTDEAMRKQMGRVARERAAAEFSSELVVPRIEALWREIAPGLELSGRVKPA